MSFNFTYTSTNIPTPSEKSLGYFYRPPTGAGSFNVGNIVAFSSGATNLYQFNNVPIGTYMFMLNGWMKVNQDSRNLRIYLAKPDGNIYTTKSAYSIPSNLASDGTFIPMSAGFVFTNTNRTQFYQVNVASNIAITGAQYRGSIELIRIA